MSVESDGGQDASPESTETALPPGGRKELLATLSVRPEMRHGATALAYTARLMGEEAEWSDLTMAYKSQLKSAAAGDMGDTSRLLMAQAITLDAIFTNMAQRAAANLGHYPEAVDHYLRHALKAQANSRATLEALARIHQPREQIVKHVNVNEGGQAVFAGQIHQHHQPGSDHENSTQPHGPSAPLLSEDAQGNGVPVPSDEGQKAVPHSRRQVARSADGLGKR